MKVVILCGGLGTRIRDVSESVPKPMINIGPYPVLWHIMQHYASYGFREFVLCLGYKSSVIKDFFHNFKAHTSDFTIELNRPENVVYHSAVNMDVKVTLAETGLQAMTGARLKRVSKYLQNDENFMLTYGDGVGNIDIKQLENFHKSHGKVLTLTGVRPPGRFGELRVNEDSHVTEFNEKPQATAGRINGGFFVCRREIFDYLSDSENLVFEKDPMHALVADRQLMMYEHEGFWQPMDTYRDYLLLNELYEKGNPPWVR